MSYTINQLTRAVSNLDEAPPVKKLQKERTVVVEYAWGLV
jgi:hypothetical protein